MVTSFVSDILLPILSLLPFIDRNFDEKFAVLKAGPHYGKGAGRGYNTMKMALEDGAVIMSWGYVFSPFSSFGEGKSCWIEWNKDCLQYLKWTGLTIDSCLMQYFYQQSLQLHRDWSRAVYRRACLWMGVQ